jgi:hypothetical protein
VKLFFAPDGVKVAQLASIRATGSDSHKGGKQVLILKFDASPRPVHLVYKPADIEADARIVGRTRGIGGEELQLADLGLHGIDKSFPRPGFAERIADWLEIPDAIPVYRFLPRLIGSGLPGTDALPIRNSYGYIEFLSHVPACDDAGKIVEGFDVGTSDWILTGQEQLARYYRESGRLMAMATVLGLVDLDAGNVIVHERRPFLIDLEFVYATDKIGLEMTGLLVPGRANSAGMGGYQEFEVDMSGSTPVCSRSYVSTSTDGSHHKLDGTDACSLAMSTGFAETMVCLGAHMDDVISFIREELANCVGRVKVFATGELNNAFRQAYGRELDRPMPDWKEHVDNEPEWRICFTPDSLAGSAKWFASTPQSFQRDIHGLDMPAFYRRLSSHLMLDSEGVPVERDKKRWNSKLSAAQGTVDNLKNIKAGWQLVGTPTKALDALICSGLDVIRTECSNKNKRALEVGHRRFEIKDGNWTATG